MTYLILFILLSANFINVSTVETINRKAITKALEFDDCTARCSAGLLDKAFGLLDFNNTYQKMSDICEVNDVATECMAKNKCKAHKMFLIATSGISDLCHSKKHNFLQRNEECLKENLDVVLHESDTECTMRAQIIRFSHDPIVGKYAGSPTQALKVISRVGGLCDGVICFIPEFRQSLDRVCAGSGGVLASAILRPFFYVVNYVNNLSPVIQNFLKVQVPPQCYPLGNKTALNQMKRRVSV